MNKTLIHSQQEYVELILNELCDYSVEDIENFLNVDFAIDCEEFGHLYLDDIDHLLNEGKITSAQYDDFLDYEQDYKIYRLRKLDDGTEIGSYPESYPCVVCSFIGNDYDRLGKVSFGFIEFVYPSDFEKDKT